MLYPTVTPLSWDFWNACSVQLSVYPMASGRCILIAPSSHQHCVCLLSQGALLALEPAAPLNTHNHNPEV